MTTAVTCWSSALTLFYHLSLFTFHLSLVTVAKYLAQMFLHMIDVVAHEKLERYGFVFLDLFRSKLMQVMSLAQLSACLFRRMLHDVQDVLIVKLPELNQIAPGLFLEMLHPYPFVLFVTCKYQIVGELRPHKALMIVSSRV